MKNMRKLIAVLGLASLGSMANVATAQEDPRSTSYRYDGMGRMVGEIGADPDGTGPLHHPATRTVYDANGLVLRVETGELQAWQPNSVAPASWPNFTILQTVRNYYDTLGQPIRAEVVGDDGAKVSVTQTNYDKAGRPACTALRMNLSSVPANACTLGTGGPDGPNRISRNYYDAAGQLIQVRKAMGTPVEIADSTMAYTPNGQLLYVVDANGNRAKMEYDGHDRQTRWIFPSKTRPANFNNATPALALATAGAINTADDEVYSYDNNGNRLSLRKRDNSLISYEYDNLNRMTKKVIPDRAGLSSAHEKDVYYSYDLRGLPIKTRFNSLNSVGQTNTYDGFGRLEYTTDSTAGLGALRIFYEFDANGNRTEIKHPSGARFRYVYDKLDRPYAIQQTTTTLGVINYNQRGLPSFLRWTNSTLSDHKRTFAYDNVGRLAAINLNLHGTSKDVHWGYTRNPASQILKETQSNDTYSWDGQGTQGYSRSYATNGLNQYTNVGGDGFGYDANGNLTSDGSRTFTYDVENRLVEVVKGTETTNLYYDPLGRLYRTSSNKPGYGTVLYLYDGNALIAEYASNGTMLKRYVHGGNPGADDPLIEFQGGSTASAYRKYLHADPRGSIVAVTDYRGVSNGTNTYDEYGIGGSTNTGRFQYTGQAWLPEIELYYYKARIYSPKLGRFLQTDPIGYEDQYNLYGYVGNDPINMVDPSGTDGCRREGCPRDQLVVTGRYPAWAEVPEGYEPKPGEELFVYAMVGSFMLVSPFDEIGAVAGAGGKILWRALPATTSSALRVAASGGRHSGFLSQALGRSTRELHRSSKNLRRNARNHRNYMRNNNDARRYIDGKEGTGTWDNLSPIDQARTRDAWRIEVENYSDQADIVDDLLEMRNHIR